MKNLITIIFIWGVNLSNAQQAISAEEVVKRVLTSNSGLQSINGNTQVNMLLNNPGAAGLTPTVSLNGSLSGAVLNSYQEFSNNTNQDRNGAASNGLSASINADWLVYDGGKMFAVKRRLAAQTATAVLLAKEQAIALVSEALLNYYELVRLQTALKYVLFNLDLAKERFKLVTVRLNTGADSKVEWLLSKNEVSRAEGSVLQVKIQMANTSAKLSALMGEMSGREFIATDSLTTKTYTDIDALRKQMVANNLTLLKVKSQNLILSEQIKEATALRLPQVQMGGAYVFNRSQSQAGFLTMNRQTGLNVALIARWNLYSGGRLQQNSRAMELQLKNNEWLYKEATAQAEALLWLHFRNYELGRILLEGERQSVSDCEELVKIAWQRYSIGKSQLLENIETQRILEEAQSRYITALYNLKVSEINLMKVTGLMIQ
jgi:outer membrane protein TolC